MRSLLHVGFIASVTLALAAPACGSEDGNTAPTNAVDSGTPVFTNYDGGLPPSCATETHKAEKLPLDMAIGLDTSFSMDFYDKWPSVQSALKAFIKNPAYSDLGIALQFFPLRKQCSIADYKVPAVPMALLPIASGPISSALDAQKMSGGTPMVPLLQGLSAYLQDLAPNRPKRKPVIVLATDGIPDDTCSGASTGMPNTIENAVAIADAAAKGTPSVQTFVIGVGSELTALSAIAKAGGTNDAVLVDTTQNVEQAFLKALDNIRRQAIPCDFDIPSATTVDAAKTNVTYSPAGGGASELFVYTDTEAGCVNAPDNGWYFDDLKNPKKVILCAGACGKVKNDDKGSIDVVFGCDRVNATIR